MKRVFLFGTGSTGRRIFEEVKENVEVIGFLDNDKAKWGENIKGVSIIDDGRSLSSYEYDEIIICSLPGLNLIQKQLIEAGISRDKINTDYISTQVNARINFIRDFANLHQNLSSECAVAEGGVFQGEFAKEINSCFPKQQLYLFDTFEGFDEKDVEKEHSEKLSELNTNHLSITNVDLVMSKMPYKENVQIRKGYFPETTKGMEDEKFFFVNLDFDLYNPTLAGLKFFYPRLQENGILLIHDYYNPGYAGIKKAIEDFEAEMGMEIFKFPIGDHCSIAITKGN